ncbi:MAG: hypothetical protein IJR44_01700, partial [Neisseriaceae bacterium]|nr:hypothetical protein [Neisseriaceae bacterium]
LFRLPKIFYKTLCKRQNRQVSLSVLLIYGNCCVDQWIPYFTCEYHASTTRASFNHTALITACSYH